MHVDEHLSTGVIFICLLFVMLYYLFFVLIELILIASSNETTLSLETDKSNNDKDGIKPSNDILLRLSLNTKGIYDPVAVGSISKAFYKHKLLLPKTINQKIVEYASPYDETINEFYDRIMNELRKITEQQLVLNIHDPDFLSKLSSLITNNEKEIPLYHEFWNDLERFLFKYALSTRKRFANNNKLFEKSIESIKDIANIIGEKTITGLNVVILRSMIDFDFLMFDSLVVYEAFDHPQLLEIFFKNIIDEKGELIMSLDQIEKEYCNGSFDNNNPFLKMMIIEFAFGDLADEQMLKRGWIESKAVGLPSGHSDLVAPLKHVCLRKEGKSENVTFDNIEILESFFTSQSMLKFFIDNNLQFRIDDLPHLVQFLRRLEYIGGLPKEVSSIGEIIKFKFENGIYEWNEKIFEDYLTKAKEEARIPQDEYERFIKLIE